MTAARNLGDPLPAGCGVVGDVWAVINVIQSAATAGTKLLWVVLILVLPLIGLVIWFFAGPRKVVP